MPKLREFFCSLLKSRRGSSSVEFVIIAPVLLAALVSGVVVFDAVRAKRQTGLAVQTASDLITRLDFINDGRRDNIFAAARTIIGKYDNGSNLVMTMSSIAKPVDPDSEDLVLVWSEATDPKAELEADDLGGLDLPNISDGDSIILVQFSLDYVPVLKFGSLATELEFFDAAIRRPRFVSEVCYELENGDLSCSVNQAT